MSRQREVRVRVVSVVPSPDHVGLPPTIFYGVESDDPFDRYHATGLQPFQRPCDDNTEIKALKVGMRGKVVITGGPEDEFYPDCPETIWFGDCTTP